MIKIIWEKVQTQALGCKWILTIVLVFIKINIKKKLTTPRCVGTIKKSKYFFPIGQCTIYCTIIVLSLVLHLIHAHV
jgi:hypothetical protein